jgi:hypothetical protein
MGQTDTIKEAMVGITEDMAEVRIMGIMVMVDMVHQEVTVLAGQGEMGTIREKGHLRHQRARNCNLPVTFVVDVNSSKSPRQSP